MTSIIYQKKLSNAAEMEISSRGKSSLIPLLRLIVHGLQIHGEIHSLCWWLLTCLLAELGKDEVEIFPCLFVVLWHRKSFCKSELLFFPRSEDTPQLFNWFHSFWEGKNPSSASQVLMIPKLQNHTPVTTLYSHSPLLRWNRAAGMHHAAIHATVANHDDRYPVAAC